MDAEATKQETSSPSVEPLYVENTLLRVFGVLFCHDPKRARTRTGKVELNKGVKDKNIAIRFDPEYAQPGPFAHKVAVAVIRKQSRYGRPIQKEISFSQRELMRLAGRKTWGGKDSDELAHALRQIRYTHVIASFKLDQRFVERDFSIFNEVIVERRSSHQDPIVACTVVLADPIVQSLNDKHFTCLNHTLMQQLGTIGQALYMRLFFHFATQYDGHHANRLAFQKRYDAICDEWLGGLTILKYPSKVEQEQLGPHLRQLVAMEFLSSYTITKAKSGEGLVVTFRPGKTFVADYRRFYANRFQGEVQFEFHNDQQEIGEPHKVACLFHQKRTGQPNGSIPYVSSGEVKTAQGDRRMTHPFTVGYAAPYWVVITGDGTNLPTSDIFGNTVAFSVKIIGSSQYVDDDLSGDASGFTNTNVSNGVGIDINGPLRVSGGSKYLSDFCWTTKGLVPLIVTPNMTPLPPPAPHNYNSVDPDYFGVRNAGNIMVIIHENSSKTMPNWSAFNVWGPYRSDCAPY